MQRRFADVDLSRAGIPTADGSTAQGQVVAAGVSTRHGVRHPRTQSNGCILAHLHVPSCVQVVGTYRRRRTRSRYARFSGLKFGSGVAVTV